MRRRAIIAALLVVVLLVGAGAMLWASQRPPNGVSALSGAAIGGPFSLVSGAGAVVTDRDFRGKFMLVYFGYTFCPDVCPTTLAQVADAMDRLGDKAARIQPLFITVDPARDTPAVMAQYTAAFSPKLIGLTGTPDQIAAAAKAYRVYYAPHTDNPASKDYVVDHSSILYLMGPDGGFVAPVRADASGAEMAAEITKDMANR